MQSLRLATGALALWGGFAIAGAGQAGATGPVITSVGSLADAQGSGVRSLSVSPKTAGDAEVLLVKISSGTTKVSSVSGGGAKWTKVRSYEDKSSHDLEVWLGTISTTGASSINVVYSASVGSTDIELTSDEFSSGLGASSVWSKVVAGGRSNASSTTVASPALTPAGTGELYIGYSRAPGNITAGSTSGFTYQPTQEGNMVLFDPSVSAAVAPTSLIVPANTSASIGALIAVSAASGVTVPTVSAISPASGPAGGGTVVTVSGTNFASGATVHFGATAATGVSIVSANSLTASAPAGSGTVDVTVTTAGGTSATSAADTFTYLATGPTVSAISPASGPAGGGTVVTVSGTNFASGATVHFGATAATGVSIVSANSLTASAPAGSGTVDVTVTTAGGTSATSAADTVTYLATGPVITSVGSLADAQGSGVRSLSVSPKTAGDAEVLLVKISSGTTKVSSVSGGGAKWTKVRSYEDKSSHDLEVWLGTISTTGASSINVVYSASVGSTDIELTSDEFSSGLGASSVWSKVVAGGRSNASSTTVASPALTPAGTGELYIGYSRAPGNITAGSTSGFTYQPTQEGNMVLFDPSVSAAVAPTSLIVPANTSASIGALIAVSAASGVTVPTVSAISPASGPAGGGTVVTVSGTNFASGATVHFGATAATGVSIVSANSLTASAPAGSGTVDVTVTTAGGTSATSAADTFTYLATGPTVSAISPASGPAGGGTVVTVSGTNFASGATVHFGATAATGVSIVSANSLTASAPAGSGTVDVTVTTAGGTSATSAADTFTYLATGPTVSAISPASGPAGGGTVVTVSGTNFASGATVHFGATAATGVSIVSANSLTASAPAGSGTVDVTVTTAGGTSATSAADTFTYLATGPTVSAISPASGPAGGGTVVTVSGTNFASGATVHFGATAATGVSIVSANSLTASAPAGSGTVDVTVTTAGGTSATSAADTFTYLATGPVITSAGSLADQVYNSGGTTLAVTPQSVGDVLVVAIDSHDPVGVTTLSGGGVTTWNKAVQFVSTSRGHDIELWFGTVTSTASASITFMWPASSPVSGYWTEYVSQEFTAGLGSSTVWSVDNGQAASVNGPLSSTVPFPQLTPSHPGDLYYGYAGMSITSWQGSTPGFTYGLTGGGNIVCSDTAVSATVQPSATIYPASTSENVGALLTASL